MKTQHKPGDKLTIKNRWGKLVQTKVIEVTLWRRDNTVAYLVKEFGSNKTYWLQYDAAGLLRRV